MSENFRDHKDSGDVRRATKELGQEVYKDIKGKPVVNHALARTASRALHKATERAKKEETPTKPMANRFNPSRWERAAAAQTRRDPDKDD